MGRQVQCKKPDHVLANRQNLISLTFGSGFLLLVSDNCVSAARAISDTEQCLGLETWKGSLVHWERGYNRVYWEPPFTPKVELQHLRSTFGLLPLKTAPNDGTDTIWLPRPNKPVSHKIQNRSILQAPQPGAVTKTTCFQKILDFRLLVWVSFFTCSPFSTPKCLAMPSELFHAATATSLTQPELKQRLLTTAQMCCTHALFPLLVILYSPSFPLCILPDLWFEAVGEHWMPWFLLSFDVALQYLPSLSWCMWGKNKDD